MISSGISFQRQCLSMGQSLLSTSVDSRFSSGITALLPLGPPSDRESLGSSCSSLSCASHTGVIYQLPSSTHPLVILIQDDIPYPHDSTHSSRPPNPPLRVHRSQPSPNQESSKTTHLIFNPPQLSKEYLLHPQSKYHTTPNPEIR